MRLTRIDGAIPLVQEAINQIELRAWLEFNNAANRSLEALESIQRAARQPGPCQEDALPEVWRELTDSTENTLRRALEDLIQIGFSHPIYVSSNPADWAYDVLRPHVADMLDWAADRFVPAYLTLLGDSDENETSLVTDWFLEIDNPLAGYVADAKTRLAGRGWTPAGPKGVNDASQISTFTSSAPRQSEPNGMDLRFTLADIGDPSPERPRHEVVRFLHPLLKKAIKETRKCVDVASQLGQKPTLAELADRFPVLRTAKVEELDHVLQGGKTPHECSIDIMHGRAPDVARSTIERYIRPMVSPRVKSRMKNNPRK